MSRETRLIILGLVIIGFALYAFNLNDALFWDDDDWIIDNPAVHALAWENVKFLFSHDILAGIGQHSNYYRPVLMLSFALNWAVSGPSGWSYHLVSNLLHLANAVLVFLLLSRLLATLRRPELAGRATIVAAIAALFWLIHPFQTEAVTYVSGRGDALSVFFMLSAAMLLLRAPKFAFGTYHFPAALALALLGILSRETAVLFPGYLVLLLMTFGFAGESFLRACIRSLKAVWPFIALSAAYLIARMTFLSFGNLLNWHRTVNVYSESVTVRIWTFLGALREYIRLTVFPVGLHMERTVPVLTSPFQWPVPLVLTILVIGIWFLVFSWKKGNRIPFFGFAWMLLALAPASGIAAPINSLIYEHWMYLPLLGPAVLLTVYGVRLYEWARARSRVFGMVLLVIGACYLVFLSAQTIARNRLWGDTEAFYRHILSYVPDNVRVLNNLANLYAERGDPERAENFWTRAVEADPTQPAPYHNLGNLARDRGEPEEAEQLYLTAISVDERFHYAYRNLVALYLEQRRFEESAQLLAKLLELQPTDASVYYVFAQLMSVVGENEFAVELLRKGAPFARTSEQVSDFEQLLRRLTEIEN